MAVRRCTAPGCNNRLVDEDGNPRPAGTKTCSNACRQKRARHLKKIRTKGGNASKFDPAVQDVAAAVRGEVDDVAHAAMVEELRPIVRDAMTDEVLAGIDTLIKLTPRAIEVLSQQVESSDETISQRAVTLLLKYTMGNPSVAPPPTQQAPAPMSVVFNIPRPGDTTQESEGAQLLGDAEELRTCSDCGEERSDAEMVGGSDRCTDCFEMMQAKVEARLANG